MHPTTTLLHHIIQTLFSCLIHIPAQDTKNAITHVYDGSMTALNSAK
jgi:hypothetical protein